MDPSTRRFWNFFHAKICGYFGQSKKSHQRMGLRFDKKYQALLLEIESKIHSLPVDNSYGPLSSEEESSLKSLLVLRQDLLAKEESKWRLKSRAIWLKEGDNNGKFYHKFVNFRKNLNSMWKITDQNGQLDKSFEDISRAGRLYFGNLFKEPLGCPIEEMLKLKNLFPMVFNDEMNDSLIVDITEGKFLVALSSLQKGKIPGPDGLSVEFYLGFCELLKDDLLKVVQESKCYGKVLGSFNTTHLALIPRKKEAFSFEDFR
jgi:hypothetical protein